MKLLYFHFILLICVLNICCAFADENGNTQGSSTVEISLSDVISKNMDSIQPNDSTSFSDAWPMEMDRKRSIRKDCSTIRRVSLRKTRGYSLFFLNSILMTVHSTKDIWRLTCSEICTLLVQFLETEKSYYISN